MKPPDRNGFEPVSIARVDRRMLNMTKPEVHDDDPAPATAGPHPPSRVDQSEVDGNRLLLLDRGQARLDALLELIDDAQVSLRLLYYIFADDHSGKQVRDALVAARARGVTVALLVDGFGSDSASEAFFEPLVAAGADFCRYEPRFGRRYLLRNHQKLALADDSRVIIGGFNIEDSYFGIPRGQAWRDLGLLVEGPSAMRLSRYFDALFAWSRQERPRLRDLNRILNRFSEQQGALRWLHGGPTRRLSPWARAVKHDMASARRFDMIAAYFAPNGGMLRRIGRIVRRGGQSRIVTAAKSDNGATIGAARHCYARLLRRDVEIHEYQPTKLHMKLLVIDGVTYIGSANFDMRSLFLNLELMLRIEDADFADRMRGFFENELEDCVRVTPTLYREYSSPLRRLLWGLCYFVVSVVDYGVSRRLNFGIQGGG